MCFKTHYVLMVLKRQRLRRKRIGRRSGRSGRYTRRAYRRSYTYRKRTYKRRRYSRRKLANEYVAIRASFTGDPEVVLMQGTSQDSFNARLCQFNGILPWATTTPVSDMLNSWQRYRIKRVSFKFIPNKRAMSGQILTPATTQPMNPPHVDIYTVPIADKQTFSVKNDLSDIIEQGGFRRKVSDRPFTVSFIPKVEQIRQYSVLGNTYSTVRRPWFPTDLEGQAVQHFGTCVYIRRPYDPLLGAGFQELLRYQVEVTAIIEFKAAK